MCAAFKARYSLDVKFGNKLDAVALLQEWVQDVGSVAGLTPQNTQLHTGSIGAPESTLELEVGFETLAELEDFWTNIPPAQHRAWGQRMQEYIVHGTPQWQVYRCLAAFPEGSTSTSAAPAAGSVRSSRSSTGSITSSSTSGSLLMPSEEEMGKYAVAGGEGEGAPPPGTRQQTTSGLEVVKGDEEAQVVLDWKGDPMTINPGDKMPFRFL